MLDFMMKRLHGNKKKGFTLVELIVVLVILAILLAILVPALLGYIDKAREKQAMVDARTAYLACQTAISEDYGKATATYSVANAALSEEQLAALMTDANKVDSSVATTSVTAVTLDANGAITHFVFEETTNSKKYTCTYGNGAWTAVKS